MWPKCVRIVLHAELIEELRRRMVAGQREYLLRWNLARCAVLSDLYMVSGDLEDLRVEVRYYLALLEPVLDIGPDPVLHSLSQGRTAMN